MRHLRTDELQHRDDPLHAIQQHPEPVPCLDHFFGEPERSALGAALFQHPWQHHRRRTIFGRHGLPRAISRERDAQQRKRAVDSDFVLDLARQLHAHGFRAVIFEKNQRLANGAADIIYSTALPVTAMSFAVPTDLLETGGDYAINFQVIETVGDIAFTSQQTQILSRSSSYFSFSPLPAENPSHVHLPQVGVDPNPNDNLGAAYVFSILDVGPTAITYIDPDVAIGYHCATGAGDPHFASVIFPHIGDGLFELHYESESGRETRTVRAGDQFFFQTAGVAAFTVPGIEPSSDLDPDDPTAFITGLTFVSNGSFTGTMTPITAAVPEPETYALMLARLGILGLFHRRRRLVSQRRIELACAATSSHVS